MAEVWDVMINGKFSGTKVTKYPYYSKLYADKSKVAGEKYYLRPECSGNAPDIHDIDYRKGVLVKRWSSRGDRYWYELYRFPYGLFYYMDNGGGQLGSKSVIQAVKYLEKQMADAGRIDGIHYDEVYPRERPIAAAKHLKALRVVPNKKLTSSHGISGLSGIR